MLWKDLPSFWLETGNLFDDQGSNQEAELADLRVWGREAQEWEVAEIGKRSPGKEEWMGNFKKWVKPILKKQDSKKNRTISEGKTQNWDGKLMGRAG